MALIKENSVLKCLPTIKKEKKNPFSSKMTLSWKKHGGFL